MRLNWLVFSSQQLELFWYSCIFGAMLGALYDVFRILRLIFFKDRVTVFVQDILFWTIAGFCSFLFFLASNYGHIRLYLLLGMIIGAALYYLTIGKAVYFVISSVCDGIRYVLKWIWRHTVGAVVEQVKKHYLKRKDEKKGKKKVKKSPKNKKTS